MGGAHVRTICHSGEPSNVDTEKIRNYFGFFVTENMKIFSQITHGAVPLA
ncbi:Uncharacterised protein [Mycobacteroides abscessus subsp. abscessus]|nr:Uncharacterised protein [Mycobacteroides abscessus subsp. abscessus]